MDAILMVYPDHHYPKYEYDYKKTKKDLHRERYFEQVYRPNNLWKQMGGREPICTFEEFEEFKRWLIESEFSTQSPERVRKFVDSVANLQDVAEILYLSLNFEIDTHGGQWMPDDLRELDD